MNQETQILKQVDSGLKLQNTPPEKGQEWCAVTYLLVPEPKTSTYGTFKIICFGSTCQEVEATLSKMMKDAKVEKALPFIQIIKTGEWRKLVAGGEKSDVSVSMNALDGTILSEVHKERSRRNAEATREMEEQMNRVKEEAAGKNFETPYEEYERFRTQLNMAIQKQLQLEKDLKQVKQARGNAITKLKVIESQHGNFRLKFDQEYKIKDSPPEIAELETTLPEGYKPPVPWEKRPSVEHGPIEEIRK